MESITHCISVACFYCFLYKGVINMDLINNMGSCGSEDTLINLMLINTLRTGAFKLFKCAFPGSKQLKSTFILCFFKNL